MLVKLQRPPPEMRIFLPGLSAWSRSRTDRPRCPAVSAAIIPAAPAPSTTTSKVGTISPGGNYSGLSIPLKLRMANDSAIRTQIGRRYDAGSAHDRDTRRGSHANRFN